MPYRFPRRSQYSTRVKRTAAGLGLVAEEAIPKDAFIIEYFGEILSNDDADEKGGKYLFEVDGGYTIDGTTRRNRARYINHSCKPNCETEVAGRRVFVYAKRSIAEDEELSYDYGKEYFDTHIKPFGCRCGHHRRNRAA